MSALPISGAYNGDTIRELLSYTDGAYDSITALEPDKRNFKKLSRYAEESLTGKVEAGAGRRLVGGYCAHLRG